MQDYFQPDFYRFSQDSLDFVNWIEKKYVQDESCFVLDLCSGCGVIGMELGQRFPNWEIDFCELQEAFYPYLVKNADLFYKERTPRFFQVNLAEFNQDSSLKYDLIVCNPPYFSPEKGRLPPSLERYLCRFFSEKDWDELFKCFARSLKINGRAYFLAREVLWKTHPAVSQVGSLAGAQVFCFDLNVK